MVWSKPVFWMRRLQHRAVESLVQGHTAFSDSFWRQVRPDFQVGGLTSVAHWFTSHGKGSVVPEGPGTYRLQFKSWSLYPLEVWGPESYGVISKPRFFCL